MIPHVRIGSGVNPPNSCDIENKERKSLMKIKHILISPVFFFVILIASAPVSADETHQRGISLDGTIGTAGKLNLPGPHYDIRAEYGQQAGTNLFHSFQKFNIHSDESATFSGPDTVQNIISRVTGGDSSWIDGNLHSTIPKANLYLLNPAGVMFGPNTSLDLSGSFHISTADYLAMENNIQFNTMPADSELLSAAPPAAFGFLSDSPTGITVNGELMVPDGQTLSLAGGNVEITNGALIAREGRINVVSTGSPGQATLNDMEVDSFEKMGNIKLTNESYIYASGSGGGNVFIRANQCELDNSRIWAETMGDDNGGVININLKELVIINKGSISGSTGGAGRGSDINIDADNIEIRTYGNIETSTYAPGQGSDLNITANAVNLDNDGIILAATEGDGNAGKISMDINTLTITGGSRINTGTSGTGHGGDIDITAKESVNISGESETYYSGLYANTYESGEGGNITLSAPRISLDSSGVIQTATIGEKSAGKIRIDTGTLSVAGGSQVVVNTQGIGHGGDINIFASNAVTISGNQSGLYANTIEKGTGGSIILSSPELTLDKVGIITAQTKGEGSVGKIELDVDTLTLTEGGQVLTNTYGSGQGGNINISAAESVSISGKSGVFQSAVYANTFEGGGNAGDIKLSAPKLFLGKDGTIQSGTEGDGHGGEISLDVNTLNLSGAQVITNTYGSGDGGDINISAKESVSISGKNEKGSSGFYANSIGGTGNGGDINIFTSEISLNKDGKIQAATTGDGDAGKIKFDVDTLTVADGTNIAISTKGHGQGGDIVIKADTLALSGGVIYGDSESAEDNAGKPGNINIQARQITMNNESQISGNTNGPEQGGDIEITTRQITLTDGARISSSTWGSGEGGTISVKADDVVRISGTSGIYTHSYSQEINAGKAGNIEIQAWQTYLTGANICADALKSGGGKITIDTNEMLYLSDSRITTSVWLGHDKGGDIAIGNTDSETGPKFVTLNNGKIQANAFEGDGGAIFIVTDNYLKSAESIVEASSERGNQGTVKIEAPDTDISSSLAVLPESFLDAARWLKTPCSARTGENASRFIIKRWDAFPTFFLDFQPGVLMFKDSDALSSDTSYMRP